MAAMATAAVVGGAGAMTGCASTRSVASAERPDCPGKVVCPLTGELVCADRCPIRSGEKSDLALAVAQPGSCCAQAK